MIRVHILRCLMRQCALDAAMCARFTFAFLLCAARLRWLLLRGLACRAVVLLALDSVDWRGIYRARRCRFLQFSAADALPDEDGSTADS